MSISKQAAKKTVHTFMTHILCSRFDQARGMLLGDVEAMNLPTDGENEKIVFTILDAETEEESVVVPVELEMPSPGGTTAQTIPFVCVEAEGGVMIDMDLTLKKLMGASPDELLDAVKHGLEGVVDEIGSALEDVVESEEELAPELYSPEYLSDEFRAGLGEIEQQFDGEIESICNRLENEELEWQIAWGTMSDDQECPRRLLVWVISPLRSALSVLEDHRSEDPEAKQDASIQKIRANIKTIRIMNMNDWRLCGITLEDGRLTLMPCLMPTMDSETKPTQGFTSDEIEWAIRDALDLDVSGAIKRAEAAVAEFVAKCGEDVGFTPKVTVDWESFRAIEGGEKALGALKRFREDLLFSVRQTLFRLEGKVPFDTCLETIHFRNVESADEQSITVDGTTITISAALAESSTWYMSEEVQQRIAEAVKELPIPQIEDQAGEDEPAPEEAEEREDIGEDEEEDEQQDAPVAQEQAPASGFQQMVQSMESDMMGPMRDQMSQMFGKPFGLEVDWDSMEQDEDHFTLVISGAMGAVMGALMAMAYDPARKEPVLAAVRGMALRYDRAVRGVALSLDDGILGVACGGPATEFTPDPTAMGEAITALLP